MSSTVTTTEVSDKTATKVASPSLYDVVFFNDQKTHHEFVVLILMHLFSKSYDQAVDLTNYVHENGRAAVATYTYEIALTKRDETVATARSNGHPLRVEIEPSNTRAPT